MNIKITLIMLEMPWESAFQITGKMQRNLIINLTVAVNGA